MTNIPGCFNAGESDFQYHGANRLGANSLLSCIFGGLVGNDIPHYIEHLKSHFEEVPHEVFEEAIAYEENFKQDLFARKGTENVYKLHDELSDAMIRHATVKRNDKDLKWTLNTIKEIRERYKNITLADSTNLANQTYIFANEFKYMLELALIITKGALLRNEFRGSHFKEGYTKRDDANWLKTTIATFNPQSDEPDITYEAVDLRHFDPIERDYVHETHIKPTIKNMPSNIQLPI